MKIFSKTHFWKEHRTFIELETKEPELENTYPKEGSIIVKIGEESSIKNAFKLSIDEARAMRDALDNSIKNNDRMYYDLVNQPRNTYEPYSSTPASEPKTIDEPIDISKPETGPNDEVVDFSNSFMFNDVQKTNDAAVDNKKTKPPQRTEFYF